MNRPLVALAAVFLAAHLALLPPTLGDIDSINFALGVRDFDIARHQPHPPGYPLFIALGKLSTAAFRAVGHPSPEAAGLAVWSALSGTALVLLLFAFFRALDGDAARARWATLVAVVCPLFWFTAQRPLSDTTGLATALAAQVLLAAVATGRGGPRALVGGAFFAGLAIGFRSQAFVLTLPLLGYTLLARGLRLRGPDRVAALAASAAGVLAWGVPLIAASGGLTEYVVALGAQGGEDFDGVEMLWRAPSPRVLALALLHTFIWPWASAVLGGVAVALAAAGMVRAGMHLRRPFLVLAVAFAPYVAFHLLFQEFETVRYALPLVVPVAYLACLGLEWAGPRARAVGAGAIAAVSIALTLPASIAFGREPGPGFAMLRDLQALPAGSADVGFHGSLRRTLEWQTEALPGRLLAATHGHEWLSLVSAWRSSPDRAILFAANPRRTDLALLDPQAREPLGSYRWTPAEPAFVGGARPWAADLYRLSPPGWMLDRGWAVTAEVGGVTNRDRLGPHVEPSIAWVRARAGAAELMLGGRHLGSDDAAPQRVRIALDGRPLDSIEIRPGAFFRVIPLPAGSLRSTDAYVPLQVSVSPDGEGGSTPVALEQFDLQPAGVPMVGVVGGWQEPEYSRAAGRPWRWASDRAALWVRPVGRDVTLTVAGESPLRYFDRAPVVTVTVGDLEVARFSPSADFSQSIVLPADALDAASGRVDISSDLWFVPGDRTGSPDRRRLALRIYTLAVR